MSDKPDDLAWWNGEPINAMTREKLQAALIDANLIIDKQKEALKLANIRLDALEGIGDYD